MDHDGEKDEYQQTDLQQILNHIKQIPVVLENDNENENVKGTDPELLRNNEQQVEPSIAISSSLSTSEIQDHSSSNGLSDDNALSNCAVNNSTTPLTLSSSNEKTCKKSIPSDISMSCNDAPVQKILSSYPTNQQNRSFQSNWFRDRIWLEYSVENDACYCYYCRHFSSNQLNADDAFATTGFNNWKKALNKSAGLMKHASSQAHIIATKNYLIYKQQQAIDSNVLKQLDNSRAILIRKNRDRLVKISSTLLFLARQMISFRGHQEDENSSNQGNFLEFLRWASTTDPAIKSILEDSAGNATYLSHDIQNELINVMSNEIREEISFMLNKNKYALMADECRDVSGTQQLSIVIRFVPDPNRCTIDKAYIVKEYFLGFIPLAQFDAETLANKIVEFLNYWKIPLEFCICLCFDGASVMSGCVAGVHVYLKKYMPNSVYVHCAAHRLNLVISDTCKVVCYVSDYFSIVSQIYTFFTESGVANIYFKQAQIDLGLVRSSTLKLWTITRWDSRWIAIDSIVNNFPAIVRALRDLSEDGSGTRSTNALGILIHVKKSVFIISPSLDYVRGEHLIKSVIQQFKDLRNDQCFYQIYDKAKEFCSLHE
ncbi:unnamed protein product, partial [Rotaria sp. Silwood1]